MKMRKKTAKLFLLTVLAVLSILLIVEKTLAPGLLSKPSPYKNIQLLTRVVRLVQSEYIEEANPAETMEGAFKGLVNSLDVLSCYLNSESVLRYRQRIDSDLKDTGIILYKRYGSFPQVIGLIENSPAVEQGIQLGDLISGLDGRAPEMMSLTEVQLYLKSQDEKPINLRILRGQKTHEVDVKRKVLFGNHLSFIPAKGTSGILRIHRLYTPVVKEIKEKIVPRLKSGKDKLVLDLRNCYEGDTQEARELINLFLKAPEVGYFEKKGKPNEPLDCPDRAELEIFPLVVWTNQATMGPAEIVAGVLKELKRARVIGSPTLGLTAKQNFFLFEDGSGLLLTSGIFFLKSGKKLWQNGIKPDVLIKTEDQTDNAYLEKSLSSSS